MKLILIATNVIKKPHRLAGIYQAAYRVTIGDVSGLVVHTLEYDKRDIMDETVMAEPAIAAAMRAEIDPEDWDPAGDGFCDTGKRIDNKAAMEEAIAAATETIYEQQ